MRREGFFFFSRSRLPFAALVGMASGWPSASSSSTFAASGVPSCSRIAIPRAARTHARFGFQNDPPILSILCSTHHDPPFELKLNPSFPTGRAGSEAGIGRSREGGGGAGAIRSPVIRQMGWAGEAPCRLSNTLV
jgi:hypothetical protein